MKTIKIFLLLIAGSILAGCNLDTEPHLSKDVDNLKQEDLQAITLGTYSYMKVDNGLMRTYHYVAEYGGDNISLSGSTSDPLYYIYSYQRNKNNSRVADLWMYCYKTIININKALEVGVEGESEHVNIVIGENYFMRAYHYLCLVTIFGKTYMNNPDEDLGVPLKLTSDKDEYPPRTTVFKIYEQIEKDLLKAIDLMTITNPQIKPKSACYVTKEAAEALLSRVYLYMGRYGDAAEYADAVIGSGRFRLMQGSDYVNYPTYVPESNPETIFAIRLTKDIDLSDGGAYNIGSMYATIDNVGWGEMYSSDSYLRILDRHPEDLRHGYIKKQFAEGNEMIFIYSNLANGVYNYVKVGIEEDAGGYKITNPATADGYGSPEVFLDENYFGGQQYYLLAKDDSRIYGRVERRSKERNSYPMYFIYKCSLQEGQHHLWSPIVTRLGEMYLNRAEGKLLGDGTIQEALDDINVIRRRAQIPEWTLSDNPEPGYVTVPDNSKEGILELVLQERRIELAFEAHRRMDIFRHKRAVNRRYPGGHMLGADPKHEINYNDDVAIEYIPQREIDAYPITLEQNP